jgi:hypothetical protein
MIFGKGFKKRKFILKFDSIGMCMLTGTQILHSRYNVEKQLSSSCKLALFGDNPLYRPIPFVNTLLTGDMRILPIIALDFSMANLNIGI